MSWISFASLEPDAVLYLMAAPASTNPTATSTGPHWFCVTARAVEIHRRPDRRVHDLVRLAHSPRDSRSALLSRRRCCARSSPRCFPGGPDHGAGGAGERGGNRHIRQLGFHEGLLSSSRDRRPLGREVYGMLRHECRYYLVMRRSP